MEAVYYRILLSRYAEGTASPKEADELFEFGKREPVLFDQLLNEVELEDAILERISSIKVADEISIRVKQRILSSIEQVPKEKDHAYIPNPIHRIHFLKTTWFRYAAAIILMLGVGSYLWFSNIPSNSIKRINPTKPNSDIPPGSDKALLTLADGQQIILDSTQGNIVKQGNLTVINKSGKLDYEGIGSTVEYHTLSTPKGGQYQLVLPDGSKVWLNAASSIKFPTVFTKDRVVEITGESYLEVAANKTKPFFVKANGTTIQVLGTSFNVNAYINEAAVKTTLLEGVVKLIKGPQQQLLQPGEQGIVFNDEVKVNRVNIDEAVSWKNGLFNFNGTDLPGLMRQLERWYNIDVRYEGKIKDRKFGGKLPRSFSLSDIVESLEDMNIHCKMEGRTLIVQ